MDGQQSLKSIILFFLVKLLLKKITHIYIYIAEIHNVQINFTNWIY